MFFFKGSLFLYFLFLWFWCLLRKQNCESSPSKQSFEINSARALESVATECRDKGTYSHKHLCSIPTPCNHTSQTTKWKTGVFQADTIHSLGRDLKDLTLCGPRDSADGKPTASCLRLKPTDLVSFNIHIPTPDRRWLVSLPSGWEGWHVGWLRLFVRCRSEEFFISICSILFLFFSRGIIHWVISLLALLASVLFFLPSFLSSSLPPFLPSFLPPFSSFLPTFLPSFLLPLSPLSLSVLQVCLLCWLLFFFLGLFVYNLQSWLMTYFFVRVEKSSLSGMGCGYTWSQVWFWEPTDSHRGPSRYQSTLRSKILSCNLVADPTARQSMAKVDANKFETLICYAAMLLVNVVATEAFKQGDVCLDSNSCLLLQSTHFCISEQNVERDGKRFACTD